MTITHKRRIYHVAQQTDEKTRLLDVICSMNSGKKVNAIEFALSSGYSMDSASQPAISENASLTAPTAETTARTQEFNVVQLFQRAVEVSYLKSSSYGQMSGINIAGQDNNVPSELDFQIARRMSQMKMDLGYTLINGVYQYSAGTPATAIKTRGIAPAITTNVTDGTDVTFTPAMIDVQLREMISNGADVSALEIWVNPAMLMVLTEAYKTAGQTVVDSRTEMGTQYNVIITNFGTMRVFWDNYIPEKTILFLNTSLMSVVELDVPGKGNFFYEPLAKTGAGERGQIYAQCGVDYGAEWQHGKIINIGVTT